MNAVARFLVIALADGRLPGPVAARVRARVFADEAWARLYHERRVAERAVDGGAGLSSRQLAMLADNVLPPAAAAASNKRANFFAAAGALACAAVVLVVVFRPDDDATRTHARGGDAPVAGVHVRCVDASRANVLAEADVVAGAKLACPAAGLLAFSATNTSTRTLWVSGLAVADQADSASLFTLPFAGEPAFAVAPGSIDVPLPRGFPLAGVAGAVHVSAALVDAPPSSPQPAGAGLLVEVTP